ncbi:MAG: hypothetical protein JO353_02615 [Phycisphaerae bacterium]|nr:hypothetical protein [Phycisphaerae bacterium]
MQALAGGFNDHSDAVHGDRGDVPAAGDGRHSHAWRLHLQLDVDHQVPHKWEITTPKNTGKSDEKNVLRRNLKPGHTYVMDPGTRLRVCAVYSVERHSGGGQQLRTSRAYFSRLVCELKGPR